MIWIKKHIKELVELFELQEFINQPVRKLSLGQRMRNEFSKDLDIDFELCELCIKNGHKDLGLGSKISEYVINLFRENNKKKVGLWCIKENVYAILFYNKKGGIFTKEKTFTIENQKYIEVAFTYDL